MRQPLPNLWMDRLCQGSIAAVLSLYTDTAVLIPTYGKQLLCGHGELAGYFRKFTGERPGLCGSIDSMIVQRVGLARVSSGEYSFVWRGGSSRARYTFVSTNIGISTHHSSEVPS